MVYMHVLWAILDMNMPAEAARIVRMNPFRGENVHASSANIIQGSLAPLRRLLLRGGESGLLPKDFLFTLEITAATLARNDE